MKEERVGGESALEGEGIIKRRRVETADRKIDLVLALLKQKQNFVYVILKSQQVLHCMTSLVHSRNLPKTRNSELCTKTELPLAIYVVLNIAM